MRLAENNGITVGVMFIWYLHSNLREISDSIESVTGVFQLKSVVSSLNKTVGRH